MNTHTIRSVILAAAVLSTTATGVTAQIRGSERGSTSQVIDGTTIKVDYARPTARGRHLFGGLVPFDVVWTPGANWATTLETDKDIQINGVEIAAGAYSVWMTPHESDWTMTLNENTQYFHFQKPDTALGKYQIKVTPEPVTHTEMLTWSFPAVSGDAALLAMQWGETSVPMQVMVEPTEAATLPAEERALFVGEYAIEVVPGIGYPTEAEIRVREGEGGKLRAWMSFPIHPGDALEFDLIPAGLNRFSPGLYQDGRFHNVEAGVAFEFEVKDKAVAVTMRGVEGTAFATGPRVMETSH